MNRGIECIESGETLGCGGATARWRFGGCVCPWRCQGDDADNGGTDRSSVVSRTVCVGRDAASASGANVLQAGRLH